MLVILLTMSASFVPRLQAAETQGKAVVTSSGVTSTLTPNTEGVFPRVLMSANESAKVSVTFASGSAGDKVAIAVLDGGSVDGKGVQIGTLDNKLQVTFNFATTTNDGLYRVSIRTAQGLLTLQFWVGAENSLKSKG